jgi:hypothetical protein
MLSPPPLLLPPLSLRSERALTAAAAAAVRASRWLAHHSHTHHSRTLFALYSSLHSSPCTLPPPSSPSTCILVHTRLLSSTFVHTRSYSFTLTYERRGIFSFYGCNELSCEPRKRKNRNGKTFMFPIRTLTIVCVMCHVPMNRKVWMMQLTMSIKHVMLAWNRFVIW